MSFLIALSGEPDLTVNYADTGSLVVTMESSSAVSDARVCLSNNDQVGWLLAERTDGGTSGAHCVLHAGGRGSGLCLVAG